MELFPLPEPVATTIPKLAPELTEDQVREQQAAARGQLLTRLEDLYEKVSGEIDRGDLEQRLDPRFVELALRIVDREMKLYRLLDAPKAAPEEEPEEQVVSLRNRQQIEQQLRELEAKLVPGSSDQ